jgi:hypothetical protein
MHYFFDININDINVTLRVAIGDSKVKIRQVPHKFKQVFYLC